MTPQRAEQIRNHWVYYRDVARAPLLGCGLFRAPVRKPVEKVMPIPNSTVVAEQFDVLEFKLEHGYRDDKPVSRVICEGLEVEIGPRVRRS